MSITQAIARLGGTGIITEADIADFSEAKRRIFLLMSDGQWHRAEAIKAVAGVEGMPAAEGLRRMRSLRDVRGLNIERRNVSGRTWEYQLVIDQQTPVRNSYIVSATFAADNLLSKLRVLHDDEERQRVLFHLFQSVCPSCGTLRVTEAPCSCIARQA